MVVDSVRVAGIDCGTNSIRLIIADVTRDGMNILVPKIMRVNRLGEGVDKNRIFSHDALERTYGYCKEFADVIKKYNVDIVRFGATSATRDAENKQDFENGVYEILHTYPEVISGDDEARLSFLGATSRLTAQQRAENAPILVIDVGGGSTEFVLGEDAENPTEIAAEKSVNIGCVRMSERHLTTNPASAENIEEAVQDITEQIQQMLEKVSIQNARSVIGVSGTVTTLSLIALGKHAYDFDTVDGATISFDQAIKACDEVVGLTYKQMETEYPVIHPRRRDVISGGALIWKCVLQTISEQTKSAGHEINTYRASESGLLDGIILDAGWKYLKTH